MSDGTLRALLWMATLLTLRPAGPDGSNLMPALAGLIRHAARHAQVWVVSHSSRLIAALEEDPDCHSILLEKDLGETRVVGQGILDQPAWQWPER